MSAPRTGRPSRAAWVRVMWMLSQETTPVKLEVRESGVLWPSLTQRVFLVNFPCRPPIGWTIDPAKKKDKEEEEEEEERATEERERENSLLSSPCRKTCALMPCLSNARYLSPNRRGGGCPWPAGGRTSNRCQGSTPPNHTSGSGRRRDCTSFPSSPCLQPWQATTYHVIPRQRWVCDASNGTCWIPWLRSAPPPRGQCPGVTMIPPPLQSQRIMKLYNLRELLLRPGMMQRVARWDKKKTMRKEIVDRRKTFTCLMSPAYQCLLYEKDDDTKKYNFLYVLQLRVNLFFHTKAWMDSCVVKHLCRIKFLLVL